VKFKVVIFDLDGTIWDHEDISTLSSPFRVISEEIIEDSKGTQVKIYPYVRDTLRELKSLGLILAIASWNKENIALEALKAFNLIDFFDYYCIEYHPMKEKMIKKILEKINIKKVKTLNNIYMNVYV